MAVVPAELPISVDSFVALCDAFEDLAEALTAFTELWLDAERAAGGDAA
jgi:hypothetical protein